MSAQILTPQAAKEARIDLIENGKGTQAVHDVIVALRANRRSGTANTKTKAEVNLSGAKPWRQKGTGRARAGYASSPVWVGGGVVFGPKPRDFSKKVPKSTKRLALRKALSSRIIAGDVLMVETFAVKTPKTKEFISLLREQTPEEKVLVVSNTFDEGTYKAARNVQPALLVTAQEVNTEQLLAFKKVILTREALSKLADRLSGEGHEAAAEVPEETTTAAAPAKARAKKAAPAKTKAAKSAPVKAARKTGTEKTK